MKTLLAVSLMLVLASCSSTKLVQLETKEVVVPKVALLSVLFFKTKSKGFDLAINGTSLTGKSVIIRKDEISCGRGTTYGAIRGIGKVGEPFIMLPSESIKEFHVYCGN